MNDYEPAMFMKYPSTKQHICLTNNENRKRKTIKIPIEIGKHLAVMDGFEFGSLSNSFPVVLDACYSARGLPQVGELTQLVRQLLVSTGRKNMRLLYILNYFISTMLVLKSIEINYYVMRYYLIVHGIFMA